VTQPPQEWLLNTPVLRLCGTRVDRALARPIAECAALPEETLEVRGRQLRCDWVNAHVSERWSPSSYGVIRFHRRAPSKPQVCRPPIRRNMSSARFWVVGLPSSSRQVWANPRL